MRAAKLGRRIGLRRATKTRDAFNAEVVTWMTFATVWASKTPVSDAERVQAAQVGATLTHRYQIRWSPEVAELSASEQLDDDGQLYAISAVKEIGRREGLEITATALADGVVT